MLRKSNIKYRRVALVALGVLASVCVGIASSETTQAAECTAGSPYSCVSATFGKLTGDTTANPGETSKSRLYFSMPLILTMNQVTSYSVTITDSTGGALKSGSATIPSVTDNTSWKDLSNMNRAWGFRITEGTADDGTQDFGPIPTEKNPVKRENKQLNARGGTDVTYTLGFGVIVDAGTAAGEYTDTLTVAVVAQPREITIFDIKNMQDMTPEICAATTTPNANATQKDTDGSHFDDRNYVPEVTLVDTRGGGIDGSGKYLVRKLADGNCWMSQNLELPILGDGQNVTNYVTSTVTTANRQDGMEVTSTNYTGTEVGSGLVFTANDTDLNSTSVWTPDYFKKTYVDSNDAPYAKVYITMSNGATGTDTTHGWADNGMDGMRSYSVALSNSGWAYSTNRTSTNTGGYYEFGDSSSGEPYQRRGILYNWTAATLGSSLKTKADGDPAEDSICPRGWQLPVNGGNDDRTAEIGTIQDKSFTKLLRTYGMTGLAGASNPNYNKLNEFPLQFMRTGYYGRSYGYLAGRTTTGYWWSGTAGSATYGHYLSSYISSGSGNVSSQNNDWRGYGFAVRCVAR